MRKRKVSSHRVGLTLNSTSLEALESRLAAALSRPLPGWPAQERMSPQWLDPPPFRRPQPPFPESGSPAGGLLLLYPRNGAVHLVLTVRSRELPTHRGQVSLPGGMQEPGEELVETALREAREEVGVKEGSVRIAGALSPIFIPPSEFILHPFVGVHPAPFRPVLSEEVARVIEIPLDRVADPAVVEREERVIRDRRVEIPFFHLDGEKVWGATAMILSEFLDVFRKSV